GGGGGDHSLRGIGPGLAEHLADRGVADERGHSLPPRRGDERIVRLAVDGDDAFANGDEFFNAAVADVAETADDDVAAIRDAANLERSTQSGANEIVGKNRGEAGDESRPG